MSRTLGTNLSADANSAQQQPRTLVKIDMGATVKYLADGYDSTGSAISWDSQTWTPAYVEVSGLGWTRSGIPDTFNLVVNTDDKSLMADLLLADKDTSVTVYYTAALSSYAGSDDVVEIASGDLGGGFTQNGEQIAFSIRPLTKIWPEWVVSAANGFTQISVPGVYNFPGGSVTLERER